MAEPISTTSRVNFCFEISRISELDNVWSPEFMVQGIPWNVKVCKRGMGKEYLAIYLHCTEKDRPENWKHAAWASFKLLSFGDNQNVIERRIEPHVFDHTGRGYGRPKFIQWDHLFDDENDYVKDDNINIEIKIEAEPQAQTTRSNLKFEILEKCCSNTGLATFRLTISNVEKLMAIRSDEFVLRNSPWYLTIYKNHSSDLGVELHCGSTSIETSYRTKMAVKLLSKKAGVKPIEQIKTENIHSSKNLLMNEILSWDELFKPKNGFVENNSIVLKIEIDADKPPGDVSSDASDSEDEDIGQKMECAICFERIGSQNISCPPCGHIFCTPCITETVKDRKTCPSCNAEATLDGLRRVHIPFI